MQSIESIQQRKPLQLIYIDKGHLELNYETLKILQCQIPKNNQVAIVGIVGSPKSGKSLLANYIIEYLENSHNPQYTWLKTWKDENEYLSQKEKGEEDKTFEHFPVATDKSTLSTPDNQLGAPGVYSLVIRQPVKKAGQFQKSPSILVLDIHSPDGHHDQPNIYGALVDYVFVVSSLVIYLDTLENWTCGSKDLWSPAKSIVKKFPAKRFQNCHYILRGWHEPQLFKYGSIDGLKFLETQQANECSPFHDKSHEIQSHLQSRFVDFLFHLLPESTVKFSRILRDSSKDYIKYLRSFVLQELDVEEMIAVRVANDNSKVVTMAILEDVLTQPLTGLQVSSYETNIDLPHNVPVTNDEKMDESKPLEDVSSSSIPESTYSQPLPTPTEQEKLQQKLVTEQENTPEDMEIESTYSETKVIQETDTLSALVQTKTTPEKAALEMLEKEFKPHLEILQSSKYCTYENVQNEIEKTRTKLQSFFPSFCTPENISPTVESELRKNSAAMKQLNDENNNRRMRVQDQLDQMTESFWNSQLQSLKQTALKCTPGPIVWAVNADQYGNKVDCLLQSIMTSASTDYDLEFHNWCQEHYKQKVTSLCTLTTLSSTVVNEYSGQMQIELDNAICIDNESEFTQLHEKVLLNAFEIHIYNSDTQFDANTSNWVKTLANAIIILYEDKFREINHHILEAEKQISEKAADYALEKYIAYMNRETNQGSGIFKKSEITKFHSIAHGKVKTIFQPTPNFKLTMAWKTQWQELDTKLKELEKIYLDKNYDRIEKGNRQRKLSISAAVNEYKNLMDKSISTQGGGKSLDQEELEKFHEEAASAAFELYKTEMKDVKEDSSKFELTLAKKFVQIQETFTVENDEKLARELKDKDEAEAKEEQQRMKKLKDVETDRAEVNQRGQNQKIKERPRSLHTITGPQHPTKDSNPAIFQGGIAIHFNDSSISVASLHPLTGFTHILHHPAFIAFTTNEIFFGHEAQSVKAEGQPSVELEKHDLYKLIQSSKDDPQKVIMGQNVVFLRTEEILAVFLHQLAIRISEVHNDFHPSSSCVEFVISPFLCLPAKQMIKNALNLAGFSKAHILQSTSAMALTYAFTHRQTLHQTGQQDFIVAIHSSPSTFDVVLSQVSTNIVNNWSQTGLPYVKKPGKLQGIRKKTKELVTGLHDEEKEPKEGLLKSVLSDCNLETKNIQTFVAVVKHQRECKKVEKVVQESFNRQFHRFDEFAGILQGAAAFAAWKAGAGYFPPGLNLIQKYPYSLAVQFTKNRGSHLYYTLYTNKDNCCSQKLYQPYNVPWEVCPYSNKISLIEESRKKVQWEVANYETYNEGGTIQGTTLHFYIYPNGLFDVRWSYDILQLPITSRYLWLNDEELEQAAAKLDEVFSLMNSSRVTTVDPQDNTQQSASNNETNEPVSATFATTQDMNLTNEHEITVQQYNSISKGQANKKDNNDGEFEKNRKELESQAAEVRDRLDSSPTTSSLVRKAVNDLLREIEEVLGKSVGVEPALLQSYVQRLETRAKRIK